MKLSSYINFILDLENKKLLTDQQSFEIDGFDRAVLMLDDMQDQSKIRDGEPCFYIINGVKSTIEEAKILREKSFTALDSICKERKIGLIKKLKLKFLLHKLYSQINRGQKIDTLLQFTEKINSSLLSIYDEMICLFTGGHIKYGFLIGYLIAKKNPEYKNNVIYIGEKIGIIRQIVDDLNDYKEGHHEPLGDLVNHKKRLPELLFLINASEEEKLKLHKSLAEINKDINYIRTTVLNENVKNEIDSKVFKIRQDIEEKLLTVPEKYNKKLSELLAKFISI